MKRSLFLICVLCICLCFTSCSKFKMKEFNYSIIHSSSNCKVLSYNDNEYLSDFTYFIFGNSGKKIDSGYIANSEPFIEYYDNNIMSMTVGAGSDVKVVTYYDLERELISSEYQNAYFYEDNTVIFILYEGDSAYVCMQKLFTEEFLLKRELDMGGIMTTQFDLEVKNGCIIVKHAKGEEYLDVTETFVLP